MAGTRSSARQSEDNTSSPSSQTANGTKRKADDSNPSPANKPKRGRPSKNDEGGEQKTIEETMPDVEENHEQDGTLEAHKEGNHDEASNGDAEKAITGDANGKAAQSNTNPAFEGQTKDGEDKSDPEKALKDSRGGKGVNALDNVQADENDAGKTSKQPEPEQTSQSEDNTTQQDAIQEDREREKAMPSNVLEKGIIYFFTRGRVGVDDPDSVQDIARSYFVLRPMASGAKLSDGVIQDSNKNRVFALPKKVWPKSGKDRFMVFVEQAGVNMETLKENFFAGSEYSTKTVGTRHTPGVTPVGEGVYAMTSTGGGQGTTHLAYLLTIPSEPGEVQSDMGLAQKGSFVISLKNPESNGPANAQLPEKPEYPKEFIEEFGGRGWMPAYPKHLDYANAQMLLIGEDFESSSNLDPTAKDEKNSEKETPQEELEKLEHEDDLRVEHLKGDDTIFEDLGISSKEYPKVMTTW